MSNWATIADVQLYTKIASSQEDVDSAQFMIELFADVEYNDTMDASGNVLVTETGKAVIGSRDLRYLKMAVAYQAGWMTDHPDLFTHVDIGSMNQDGIFFVYKNENASLLAPMARRALARLSWKRSNNIRVRPSTNRLVNKRFVQESLVNVDVIQPSNWDQM